ncbi:MAG: hypothetical protein ABFS56_09445 [Pseudomonadota bacterium]
MTINIIVQRVKKLAEQYKVAIQQQLNTTKTDENFFIYQESVIEAYLLGSISREQALKTLSPATIEEVEYQREALKRDVY